MGTSRVVNTWTGTQFLNISDFLKTYSKRSVSVSCDLLDMVVSMLSNSPLPKGDTTGLLLHSHVDVTSLQSEMSLFKKTSQRMKWSKRKSGCRTTGFHLWKDSSSAKKEQVSTLRADPTGFSDYKGHSPPGKPFAPGANRFAHHWPLDNLLVRERKVLLCFSLTASETALQKPYLPPFFLFLATLKVLCKHPPGKVSVDLSDKLRMEESLNSCLRTD